jgi:hypothetical protein
LLYWVDCEKPFLAEGFHISKSYFHSFSEWGPMFFSHSSFDWKWWQDKNERQGKWQKTPEGFFFPKFHVCVSSRLTHHLNRLCISSPVVLGPLIAIYIIKVCYLRYTFFFPLYFRNTLCFRKSKANKIMHVERSLFKSVF